MIINKKTQAYISSTEIDVNDKIVFGIKPVRKQRVFRFFFSSSFYIRAFSRSFAYETHTRLVD